MSIYEDDVREESKYIDFSTHWRQDDYFFFLLDSNLCCHLTPAMYIPIQFFSARVNIISTVISVVVQHWTLIIIDNDDISLSSSTDYRIQKYVYTIMFRERTVIGIQWQANRSVQTVNARLSARLFGWATIERIVVYYLGNVYSNRKRETFYRVENIYIHRFANGSCERRSAM